MLHNAEKPTDHDFRILGIRPDAGPADVKRAYRELVKRWHPDRFQQRSTPERALAEERLKEITAAYRRIAGAWVSEEKGPRRSAEETKAEPEQKAQAESPGSDAGDQERPESKPRPPRRPTKPFYSVLYSTTKRRLAAWRSAEHRKILAFGLALSILAFAVASTTSLERPHPVDRLKRKSIASLPVEPGIVPKRDAQTKKPTIPAEPAQPEVKDKIESLALPDASASAPLVRREEAIAGAHFTIGSSQADVFRIQGAPDEIRGQSWVYGLSEVFFKDGLVARYNNFDGSLKVTLLPPNSFSDPSSFFTLGSTAEDVVRAQGTPTRIEGNRWYYGFSEIHFKKGRVDSYDNFFGNLRVRMLPANKVRDDARRDFFTIGSSGDEVLAVQGTPTTIRGNLWFYQLSNILFRDGRVQYVTNSSGNLRFIQLDAQTKK